MNDETVSVRCLVDDIDQAIDFYTDKLELTLGHDASPAFAEVVRGNPRLRLADPTSSAGRPLPDGREPEPGGWNRIHLVAIELYRPAR